MFSPAEENTLSVALQASPPNLMCVFVCLEFYYLHPSLKSLNTKREPWERPAEEKRREEEEKRRD